MPRFIPADQIWGAAGFIFPLLRRRAGSPRLHGIRNSLRPFMGKGWNVVTGLDRIRHNAWICSGGREIVLSRSELSDHLRASNSPERTSLCEARDVVFW